MGEISKVRETESSQEGAAAMLSIFRSRNIAAGATLMASDVYISLRSSGRCSDFDAAVQYAEKRNWLKDEGAAIRLLDAGRRAAFGKPQGSGRQGGA